MAHPRAGTARRLFASVIALACALVAADAWSAGRLLTGVVISAGGDPMGGARVTIVDASGKVLATTITDAKGAWKVVLPELGAGKVRARIHVEGLPDASTTIADDDLVVHTTLEAGTPGEINLEVKGEKRLLDPETPTEPTKYTVEGELMNKLPGTRGDPFAAATSLPSLGRPPALSTLYIVRGAGPEESATYVDGAPLPHAFHFGGLVAVLPPGFVDSITVAPGGFGVPFGRATAGIIDVKLASPRSDGVHGTLVLDAIDAGVTASLPILPTTRVMVGARRSHVDVWIGKLLGDTVAGDLPRYIDGQAIVEHDFSKKSRLRLGVIAADDSVNVTDPNSPPEKPRSGSWSSSMFRVHGRFESTLEGGGSALAVASYGTSNDTILGELDQWGDKRRIVFGRLEGGAEVGEKKGDARLTFGMETMITRIDGTRVLSIPTSSFGGSSTFAMRGAVTVERVEPAAYVQLALKPVPALTLTPGLRLDRAAYGQLLFQPRLALRAELDGVTALKLTAGLYTRSNVLDVVNARDRDGTFVPVPVESGPVRGVQVGAGLEQALGPAVQLLADIYGRSATNVLVPAQQPARPIYADALGGGRVIIGYDYPLYSESGRARAVGTELLLRFKAEDFIGFIGYAIGRAEIRDGPNAPWRRAPLDQTHVLNAAVIFRLGAGWELGGRFRLAVGVLDSPYPATEIAPKSDPNVDPDRPLPQLAPLHSLDVRLEKRWQVGKEGEIGAYVEVRNVYDRRAREPLAYNYVYGYPVVGNGLPIIPNIGARGSF